jgi:2-methylisocitrate lyase-like PEP mutase family enzyme
MSRAAAEAFRALHSPAAPLRLLNAWDVGSAKVLAAAGAPALGTTSAGVAFALGLPDGERLGRDAMLDAVRAIAAAVDVPVSADLEAGYGDVAGTVALAIEAGAVGFNLEDSRAGNGMTPLDEQLGFLAEAREAVRRCGVPAFLNARTDGIWLGVPDAEAETLARVDAYARAGADGVFVPGAKDRDLLRDLARAATAAGSSLNVLAVPGLPSVAELSDLGIARVSSGSGPARAALSAAHAAAVELLRDGTYAAATAGDLSYAALNTIMDG